MLHAVVLVDNTPGPDLENEWGLSIYIEYDGHRILLDAGRSPLLMKNAEKLDIELNDVNIGVLSHAHYDHSLGLPAFFDYNSKAPFYIRESTAENCYSKRGFIHRYIGLPKGITENYKDRFIRVRGIVTLFSGVYLVPHKDKDFTGVDTAKNMMRFENHCYIPDDLSHEQSLVFDTENGLVIFNSCSHGGADRIIEEVHEAFPQRKLYAVIGGFHLSHSKDTEVLRMCKAIEKTGIQAIYTGHCTGDRAYDVMNRYFDGKVVKLYSGLNIDIT